MNKEEYRIYAEDAVKDISHRIDELKQRAADVDEKIKVEFDDKVAHLVTMRNDLQNRLKEFEQIPESNWNEAKKEFTKGLEFLKDGFQKLFNILAS